MMPMMQSTLRQQQSAPLPRIINASNNYTAIALRRNLITAMFTGRKPLGKSDSDTDSNTDSVSDTESAPALRFIHPAIALAIAAGAAGGVWLLVR